MNQADIFTPMLFMFALTFIVWALLFVRRVPFIKSSNLKPEQATPLELERISPSAVSNPSNNLKNLFEIPVLFYALAFYLFVTAQVDSIYLIASWVFVFFRILHSAVHCTVNIVMLRFLLYVLSTLAIWFMVARAIVTFALA